MPVAPPQEAPSHRSGTGPTPARAKPALTKPATDKPATDKPATETSALDKPADQPAHLNEVRLCGRLAADPVTRELPSGDVLVSFRLVVERPPGRPARVRAPTVDTIDCAAWRKDVQRLLRTATPGQLLEVQGALRRRFWRAATAAASRTEVEVTKVRKR